MAEALNITSVPRDDHQLDLTIELGPERTEEALRRAARIVARKARIPGFRPGKAPFGTVLRLFGREALLREVINDLGQEVYQEVLTGGTFEPYGQANLQDVKLDPVAFKLVVPLSPTVDLGDYRSIRIDAPEVSVTDAELDALLERAIQAQTAWQPTERAAEIGDTIVVDIQGYVDLEKMMDNQDWEYLLKSESGWLPGFDYAFVGLAAGDEKTFDLVYPPSSTSRFKGQRATFRAKVKAVKAKIQPEPDDAFARSLGEYADMADWRGQTLARLTEERARPAEDQLNVDALQALIEHARIAYPPTAVDETVEDMVRDLERNVRAIGQSLEDYLRLQGTTPEGYRASLRPRAEERLKGQLVLYELSEAEKLSVEAEEVDAEIARMLQRTEDPKQANSMRQFLESQKGRVTVEVELLTHKSLARLREIVTGRAPELPASAGEPVESAATAEGGETTSPADDLPAVETVDSQLETEVVVIESQESEAEEKP